MHLLFVMSIFCKSLSATRHTVLVRTGRDLVAHPHREAHRSLFDREREKEREKEGEIIITQGTVIRKILAPLLEQRYG